MYRRDRFRLGRLLLTAAAFAVYIVSFILLVVYTGRARADIDVDFDCYFLVRGCEESTSAAIVGEVYSAGGAGYLRGDEVIIACYYTKADARRVCSLLEGRGEKVGIVLRSFGGFTLRGRAAELKEKVLGSLGTAISAARLLYDTANGLEVGTLSQTAARANVKGAADALYGIVSQSGEAEFERWDGLLLEVARGAREKARGILFSKDVRYLQVSLCCAVLDAGECF